MQEKKPRRAMLALWVFYLRFVLAFAEGPALSSLFHGDATGDGQVFPDDEVAAFSNTTANGVRREGVDTALRKYAFMALSHARTGIIYNVPLPPFLDGILCQAMRVRAGSARRRGLSFNEFTIPRGMVVQTGGPFVIMVYRRIFNFTLYSPPPGYTFASPIVGIVIYTNLNTTLDDLPLPEMAVLSPNSSITAKFNTSLEALHIHDRVPLGCAYYDINGTASFTNISTYPNTCSFKILTDVAIIIPETSIPTTPPAAAPASVNISSPPKAHASNMWKIVVLAVVGGVGGLALLIAIILVGFRVKNECQAPAEEETPDDEETLQTSLIGHTRAPTAAGVRTRPVLETGSLHM